MCVALFAISPTVRVSRNSTNRDRGRKTYDIKNQVIETATNFRDKRANFTLFISIFFFTDLNVNQYSVIGIRTYKSIGAIIWTRLVDLECVFLLLLCFFIVVIVVRFDYTKFGDRFDTFELQIIKFNSCDVSDPINLLKYSKTAWITN